MRVELTAPDWATHLMSDLTDWQRAPLPVGDLRPLDLPDDAYFEYAWRDASGERREDPLNTNPRLNPWWTYACNVVGPGWRFDADAEAALQAAPAGRVLRLELPSRVLEQSRHLIVYTPADCGDRALPLVLFQDGKAHYGWGRAPQVFDRLLARGEVEPAHLVFVPPRERTPEYFFNPAYRAFLREEVLPFVAARVACSGRRIAWGASLGGLLSAQLAWEAAGGFEAVVTQSGAFLFSPDMTPGDPFHGNEAFLDMVVTGPQQKIRWFFDCGTFEWLLPSNQRLADTLRRQGADARLVTRPAGHNWVSWRQGLAEGFRFALGLSPGRPAGR
jgi:enterochelin esterase family protein